MRLPPLLLLPLIACGEVIRLHPGELLDDGPSVSLSGEADLSAETRLRHYGLDALLRQTTVEGGGPYQGRGLDYAAVQSAEGQAGLGAYLSGLATVDPDALADPDERLAYWLNAYNAWVLLAVAQKLAEDPGYTVESDGFLIFSTPYIKVGDWTLSPDDLEQGVLRGDAGHAFADAALAQAAAGWHSALWGDEPADARLHVGLNCASASCPDLPPGAFQGARIDAQLDALATAFLDNEEKGAGPQGLSALFTWYEADFVAGYGSVRAFVEAHRSADSAVDYDTTLAYDWSPNASAAPSGVEPTCAVAW